MAEQAVIRGTRGSTLRAKFTLFEQLRNGPRRSLAGATIQAVSGVGTPLPSIAILSAANGELQLEWSPEATQAMKPGRVNRFRLRVTYPSDDVQTIGPIWLEMI